ncbi:hypothetical protein [Methylobacterium durans]|uniref:Uncharacterized protein n=1 Tax=Methylobacterium durans TaxID=2202825 RepID=A0A2U8WDF9_9HYPH|nr:hypothetical protein [Methylobacterium durans]AWN43322.1 hypothetical protein DK389_25970 [Methylobacterium durans]
MAAKLADAVRAAAEDGRVLARDFPGGAGQDELPFAVTAAFDARVRGQVERDPRIEDERDRVLIAAVKLAQTPPAEEPDGFVKARAGLIAAIDALERATLRHGIVSARGARAGGGAPGERLAQPSA